MNRAAVMESIGKRKGRKSATTTSGPVRLRIAERPVRDRVHQLVELASSLAGALETLARDKDFTDQSNKLHVFDFLNGLDFYEEVKNFESGLIKVALDHTGGNQAQAAKLLRIKPTTLNSKIKQYKIEF